jgi:hypothetical protein
VLPASENECRRFHIAHFSPNVVLVLLEGQLLFGIQVELIGFVPLKGVGKILAYDVVETSQQLLFEFSERQ